MKDRLRNKIAALPEEPGVYLMKGEDGQILYVGKAKNLNKRVRFEGGGHGATAGTSASRFLFWKRQWPISRPWWWPPKKRPSSWKTS